jgi:hypothetical protein
MGRGGPEALEEARKALKIAGRELEKVESTWRARRGCSRTQASSVDERRPFMRRGEALRQEMPESI